MSNVGVKVQENEVFQHSDAIELFKRFFAGDDFPDDSDNTTAHKTLDRMTRSAVGRMFQIEQSLARSSSSVSFADRYASELSALAEAIDLAVGALAPWSCTETPTLEISSQPSFSP
jgi:hypothetical protein